MELVLFVMGYGTERKVFIGYFLGSIASQYVEWDGTTKASSHPQTLEA